MPRKPPAQPDPQPEIAGLVRQGEEHEARITALEQELAAMKQQLAGHLGVSFDAA